MPGPRTIEWGYSKVDETPAHQPYARVLADPFTVSSNSRQLQLEPYTSSPPAIAGLHTVSTNPRQLRHESYTPSRTPNSSYSVPYNLKQPQLESYNTSKFDDAGPYSVPSYSRGRERLQLEYKTPSEQIHETQFSVSSSSSGKERQQESPQSQLYSTPKPPRNYHHLPASGKVQEQWNINNPGEMAALQKYIASETRAGPYAPSSYPRERGRLQESVPSQAFNSQNPGRYVHLQEQDQYEEEGSVDSHKNDAAPQLYTSHEIVQGIGDFKDAQNTSDNSSNIENTQATIAKPHRSHKGKLKDESIKNGEPHRRQEEKHEAEPGKSKDKKHKEKAPKLSAKELEKQYKKAKDKERQQGYQGVCKYFAAAPVERKKRH
ncbi:uncharacterized protein PAC_03813 [Phialocephala subalpina]|uniref:Uncharacterized protein n=1 Tax=Phialocephala subalpina TaxID=576137 RepID=A0A1L7WMC6_9HELO|nr:uncharacterized protein PAC_03813 [Phialocephala subalpina]